MVLFNFVDLSFFSFWNLGLEFGTGVIDGDENLGVVADTVAALTHIPGALPL